MPETAHNLDQPLPLDTAGPLKVKLGLFFLLLGTLLVYAPLTQQYFYADDFSNLGVAEERGFDVASHWVPVGPHIKPIFRAYIALEYAWFGLQPVGYYVVNILIHLANVLLVYLVFARIFASIKGGFLAAMLFGLSGAHCGTIMSVTNSVQALAVLLQLLTVFFFLSYLEKRSRRPLVFSVLFFLLALFTFTCGLDLLLILPGLAFLYGGRLRRHKSWRWWIPFGLCVGLFFLLRMVLLPEGGEPEKVGPGLAAAVLTGTQGILYGVYKGFVLSFSGGSLFQHLPEAFRGWFKFYFIGFGLMAAVLMQWKLLLRKKNLLLAGVLTAWMLGSYTLPAMGRASKGSHPDVISKQMRYRYNPAVPAAGLAALLILCLKPVLRPSRHRAGVGALLVVLPVVLLGNVHTIAAELEHRQKASALYRKTVEEFVEGFRKLCQGPEPAVVLNEKFHMQKPSGVLDPRWSVRPYWLYRVFGPEGCADQLEFMEAEEAAGKRLGGLIYSADLGPEGVRLKPVRVGTNGGGTPGHRNMINGKKVVVVMPAYNAAQTLEKTHAEIQAQGIVDQMILVDDVSQDNTVELAKSLENIRVHVHEENLGYGGNQKSCYRLALEEGADIVIMVHPDYQYTPLLIPAMAAMIGNGLYHCVLGSRILGGYALKGGMPRWKYVANRFLTLFSNVLMGAKLSEYHTGYRAFSRELIEKLPLDQNSDDFVFDNQMLSQVIWAGETIAEISCPTKYFEEASSINFKRSVQYGLGCLKTAATFRACRWNLMDSKLFS